jgi:hypothetical protein
MRILLVDDDDAPIVVSREGTGEMGMRFTTGSIKAAPRNHLLDLSQFPFPKHGSDDDWKR